VTQTATSPQRKPLLDEASFQQLLSAAYVLQEHNDRLRTKEFHQDFANNLSAIVDTQKLIQTLQLDLPAAAELVAQRVQKITSASGTAIGIIEKGQLLYRAGTGSAAVEVGTRVTLDAALSADCLSKGSAQHCADAAADSQVHAELFRQRDVKAFIAVPVYHAGQVAGVLELRFAQANAFRETDLRTAELMAGLLSEAMVTAARMKWKEALASERQSMLEALERIKPQLERLGTEAPMPSEAVEAPSPAVPPKSQPLPVPVVETCSACGSDFFDANESFCGICGTARPLPPRRGTVASKDLGNNDLQSKAYAPWLTPYGPDNSNGKNSPGDVAQEKAAARAAAAPASLQELIGLSPAGESVSAALDQTALQPSAPKKDTTPNLAPTPVAQTAVESHPASIAANDVVPSPGTGSVPSELNRRDSNRTLTQFVPPVDSPAAADSLRIVPVELALPSAKVQAYPWSSAKKAQHWLETVKAHHGPRAEWVAQQWQRRRANIYLALAGLILLIVISGWGIRPATTAVAGNASPAPNGQQQAPPPPNLTLFEKFLVSVGLAEAPPAPSYLGNPDTQVWVDVHTALYHCPGSDLYGKTADGRFASQRDAQQDQFEPANRKVCQ
jgi:putative methionine-R-sulfoxide reductase with GAF domain